MPVPADPKMIRSRARNGKQRMPPVSKKFVSLFSLCYLLLEKSSKSLIPLSDCPFVLQSPPCFFENLPVSGIEVEFWRLSEEFQARTWTQPVAATDSRSWFLDPAANSIARYNSVGTPASMAAMVIVSALLMWSRAVVISRAIVRADGPRGLFAVVDRWPFRRDGAGSPTR